MTNEEAIELMENLKVCRQAHLLFGVEKEAVDMAIEALKEERPHGEWQQIGEMTYRCTNCGWLKNLGLMPYCENCGSDNRKKGEAE